MNIVGHVDEVSHEHVCGWVADANRLDVSLDVLVLIDGVVHAEFGANIPRDGLARLLPPGATSEHEFLFRFTPPLTRRRGHLIEVVLKDNRALLPNGRRRLPPRRGGKQGLMPVIVTSTGRAGTTMLMREFLNQPIMVVADAYPYEIKLASYYACAFKILTDPKTVSDKDIDEFAVVAFNDRRLVINPWNQPELLLGVGGDHLVRMCMTRAPDLLADTFSRIVQDYYGTIAVGQGKSAPGYFAEKTVLQGEIRQALRDMAGDVKELILVRDPRDYLCSARSFWKQEASMSFDALRTDIPLLETIHREMPRDVLFVRYEDLVLRHGPTRESIYKFLEIDASELVEVPDDPELLRLHATTPNPGASISRWQRDLAPEWVAKCHAEFGTFMQLFGYT